MIGEARRAARERSAGGGRLGFGIATRKKGADHCGFQTGDLVKGVIPDPWVGRSTLKAKGYRGTSGGTQAPAETSTNPGCLQQGDRREMVREEARQRRAPLPRRCNRHGSTRLSLWGGGRHGHSVRGRQSAYGARRSLLGRVAAAGQRQSGEWTSRKEDGGWGSDLNPGGPATDENGMLTVVDHPLLKMHVSCLRDRSLPPEAFRRHLLQIARLMAYPVYRRLETEPYSVTTPRGVDAVGWRIGEEVVLVPVLRAGLGLVEGFWDVLPSAQVAHLGIFRQSETLKPVRYYENFPATARSAHCFVLDPMLATGGSALEALDYLKSQGAERITLVTVISAPEGIEAVFLRHSDVPIFAAAVDEALDAEGYIVPGLGDAGDRVFGC